VIQVSGTISGNITHRFEQAVIGACTANAASEARADVQ